MKRTRIHVTGGGRKVGINEPGVILFPQPVAPFPAQGNEPPKEISKRTKFKRSGHLQNQILKYNYPKDRDPQTSIIFDQLEQETKDEVKTAKVEISELVEGIKLTPSQDKLLLCLSKLLHEKSQTADPQSKDYYTGNMEPLPYANYGSKTAKQYDKQRETPTEITVLNKTENAPKLAFTLYELTKEYKGGEALSGKDVDNVRAILKELDNKQFLLSYIETIYKKDGGRIERKIEGFRKLIELYKLSETEYGKADFELSKKEETIVTLNPIFRHQIDNNFILYPTDINRRTIIAYGSHNVSETALRLRDYLIRELTYKHYEPEIYLDRLYWLLNEKWMKEGRKKKVKEFTEKATDTVKALGLLLSYEITRGATGEEKVTFRINKDWE